MSAKQIGIGRLARRMLAEAPALTPLEAAERILHRTGSLTLARAVFVAHQNADAARPATKGRLEPVALAILIEHPDWTDTKIAKAVPCARETLYRWTTYKQARAALKSGRRTFA